MKITVFFKLTTPPERVLPEDWERLSPDTDLSYGGTEISCFDSAALELGLRLKQPGVTCQAVTAGSLPQSVTEQLYSAGFDRVVELQQGQREFQPEEMARVLAPYGKDSDLLLFGREAGLGESGLVPWLTAELLDLPVLGDAEDLSLGEELTALCRNGGELHRIRARLPLAVTIGNSPAVLRMASLRDRLRFRGSLPEQIRLPPADWGNPVLLRHDTGKTCRMLPPEDPETYSFIRRLLAPCGKLPDPRSQDRDGIALSLEELAQSQEPLIRLPDTAAGRTAAAALSARTGRSLCFGAEAVTLKKDRVLVTRSCCGGNLQQQKALPLPAVVTAVDLHAPVPKMEMPWILEDCVTEKAGSLQTADRVLICGGGMGTGEACRKARLWAEKQQMGFGLTRVGAMNGWGSAGEIVGQSGLRIHPRVCLILGAAGAGAFLQGIRGADTVIAVNLDPRALIWGAADYGIQMDAGEFLQKME